MRWVRVMGFLRWHWEGEKTGESNRVAFESNQGETFAVAVLVTRKRQGDCGCRDRVGF
jgi:hypothetical protein